MVIQYKGEGKTVPLKEADVISKRMDALFRRMDDPNLSPKDERRLQRDYDLLNKNLDRLLIGKKAGGKVSKRVMKMRGGGMATQGTKFSIR